MPRVRPEDRPRPPADTLSVKRPDGFTKGMNSITLIDRNWWQTLESRAAHCQRELLVVCPFIKARALEHLVGPTSAGCRLITRFSLADWVASVSDPLALRWLMERGARIRGVRNLHTKLYVFDDKAAILGSANLTVAALTTNHELGVIVTDTELVQQCGRHFEALWARAGVDLTMSRLDDWLGQLRLWTRSPGLPNQPALPDYGADAGERIPRMRGSARSRVPGRSRHAARVEYAAWVKLQGSATRRMTRDRLITEEIRNSGCNWACSYPKGRRPQSVQTGSTIFLARMMADPDDTLIFGRATAVRHIPGRDEATEAEIAERPFRRNYPHYLRLLNPEFIQGTFQNGISLFDLIKELGADTFASTQRHKQEGFGNTNARLTLRQRPAVELTPIATALLHQRLDAALARHGALDVAHDPSITWPTHAKPLSAAGLALLRALVRDLDAERIDAELPDTFPTYKGISARLGLPPIAGPGLGPQLRRNGLDDLDEWTRRFGFPAITGLIVRQVQRTPGEEFFRAHHHSADDLTWWRSEVRAVAEFPWRRLL